MLTVDEALELVARNAQPLAPRRVPLGDAAGLVLAEDVTSEVNSPPYDKTLMDGYAVRSADRDPVRQVLEEIGAGTVPRRAVTPGTATRIMTGAPIPEGADAVVPVEQTERRDDQTVRLLQIDPTPGQHILRLGTSLRVGDAVLCQGAVLRPIEIGILAEIGRGMVSVVPRPQVAVLPTGSELVPIGESLANGQIRNSNGPMLVAAANGAGAAASELSIAHDDRVELSRKIEQGFAVDILLLSGGVSAGDFDLVPGELAALGVQRVFHKVTLRPGKPLWFGVKNNGPRRVLIFGLPGNPVSSLVCFELFVRPAIASLSGRGFNHPPTVRARLSHRYDHSGGREAYLPSRVRVASTRGESDPCPLREQLWAVDPDALEVDILPWQGSADVATLARANGLARFPAEKRRFEPGTRLEVLLL